MEYLWSSFCLGYRKRDISVLGRCSWSKRYNGQTIQKKQPNETWGHWDSFENNFKLLIKHMGNWDDIHLLPVNLKCTLIKNSEKKKENLNGTCQGKKRVTTWQVKHETKQKQTNNTRLYQSRRQNLLSSPAFCIRCNAGSRGHAWLPSMSSYQQPAA